MFGIILIAIGEVFSEIGLSIGKYEITHKKESIYAMGFLNAIWSAIFFAVLIFFFNEPFVFSMASLPTFIIRAVIDVSLVFVALNALYKADRSTFSFLRTLSVPLLLISDLALGYSVSTFQVAGISLIVMTLLFLFLSKGLSRDGKILSLIAALLSVGTISLYKYNIDTYNSVAAEQVLMYCISLIALIIGAWIKKRENLFSYLMHPIFLLQSIVSGIASILMSFAYIFAPASIITTAKRSLETVTSIVSGKMYFHEDKLGTKITSVIVIIIGILLLALT
jgi:drug/metabolite transporter (DMT)-like permease